MSTELALETEDGHEVVVLISPAPVDAYYAARAAWDAVVQKLSNTEAMETLLSGFAPFLVSWTYPEPTDRAGLGARDLNLVLGIIRGWLNGIAEVPVPLLVRRSDGGQSEAPGATESP